MAAQFRCASVALLLAAAAIACAALAGCSPEAGNPQEEGTVVGQEKASTDATEDGSSTVAWTIDSDCTACHLANQIAEDGTHGAHSSLTCITCHEASSELEKAHEKATMVEEADVKRLRKTTVAKEACLSCHAEDYVPGKTSEITALTDTAGTTVNPHDLPDGEQHDGIVCADCHGMHDNETAEEKAPQVCLSCHHQNEYTCHTCHE